MALIRPDGSEVKRITCVAGYCGVWARLEEHLIRLVSKPRVPSWMFTLYGDDRLPSESSSYIDFLSTDDSLMKRLPSVLNGVFLRGGTEEVQVRRGPSVGDLTGPTSVC